MFIESNHIYIRPLRNEQSGTPGRSQLRSIKRLQAHTNARDKARVARQGEASRAKRRDRRRGGGLVGEGLRRSGGRSLEKKKKEK
jgi:hypothetical protein